MALFGSLKKKVLPAVGSAVGSFLSGASDFSPAIGAFLSYRQQESLIQKQMNFQERMSNTAHQREVADLLSAGINPLYTATGGNGATTPMGATGSQTDFANAFSSGIGKSLQRQMQKAQIQNMVYQNRVMNNTANKTQAEAELAMKEVENYDAKLAKQFELMASQAYASLQSGAASSSQASYMQSQTMANAYNSYVNSLDANFVKRHPWIRDLGSTFRALGISPGQFIK